MNMLSFKRK